jgi:hypothetical protein
VLPVSTDRYYDAEIQPGNLCDIKKVSSLGGEYSVIDCFSLRDFVVYDKRAPKVWIIFSERRSYSLRPYLVTGPNSHCIYTKRHFELKIDIFMWLNRQLCTNVRVISSRIIRRVVRWKCYNKTWFRRVLRGDWIQSRTFCLLVSCLKT